MMCTNGNRAKRPPKSELPAFPWTPCCMQTFAGCGCESNLRLFTYWQGRIDSHTVPPESSSLTRLDAKLPRFSENGPCIYSSKIGDDALSWHANHGEALRPAPNQRRVNAPRRPPLCPPPPVFFKTLSI